jgi:rhamnose utilization protein RhaD (predicted bifunctional aldolase and dehydrogenase)
MKLIDSLLSLTQPFVNRPDLIQGPGGNTSIKDEKGNMIIKASGFRFEEITENQGYSIVNAKVIANYFFSVQVHDKSKEEKISNELIHSQISNDLYGNKYPKPSMETGFHAVLDTFVVHTHSVWTNLINCNLHSVSLFQIIKTKLPFEIAYIPFVSPGFGLSYLITQELKFAKDNNLKQPAVFFLQNHGVVSHSDELHIAQEQLYQVDEAIKTLFKSETYPNSEVESIKDFFVPKSSYVQQKAKLFQVKEAFFKQVLFPDQTVFFNENITFNREEGRKINFSENYAVEYHCGPREAQSIHETMTAYFYLYESILNNGYKLNFLEGEEIDYINNMDMEKYRKSLMN